MAGKKVTIMVMVEIMTRCQNSNRSLQQVPGQADEKSRKHTHPKNSGWFHTTAAKETYVAVDKLVVGPV